MATILGLLIETLSAKLGVVTGRHLAEYFREEYPFTVRMLLWGIAEVSVIATDISEGKFATSEHKLPTSVNEKLF